MPSIGGLIPSYGSDSSQALRASSVSPRTVPTATNAVASGGAGTEQMPSSDRGTGDAGVSAYQQAAQKMATAAAGSANEKTDPQTAAEIAQLKAIDLAVRAHEAAHVAAGGSYVTGAADFTYQVGPDGKQYAIGGEVSIDVAPVSGDPEATIQKMAVVRGAALAPADPSAADRAVAAAAAQQAAAARVELSRAESESESAAPAPDERAAAQQSWGALAWATYAAANEPRSEPVFSAAA